MQRASADFVISSPLISQRYQGSGRPIGRRPAA
jgi:hypothetical protein